MPDPEPTPLPTPCWRYTGNLEAYLQRRLIDVVHTLEHALEEANTPAERAQVAWVLARIEAHLNRRHDRHHVKIVCKPCRQHGYLVAKRALDQMHAEEDPDELR